MFCHCVIIFESKVKEERHFFFQHMINLVPGKLQIYKGIFIIPNTGLVLSSKVLCVNSSLYR